MVLKEVLAHNYNVFTGTVQTGASKVAEAAQKAESAARAATVGAIAQADTAAKAAVNAAANPQELVSIGLQRVEAIGKGTLANIDAVRLKAKELEEMECRPDPFILSDDFGQYGQSRNDIWILLDNPTSSLEAYLVFIVMMIFILLTTAMYIAQSVPAYCCGRHAELWKPIETTTLLFFTAEYVVRFAVAPPWIILKDEEMTNPTFSQEVSTRIKFFFSPFNLVDFLSIAPFYVTLAYPDAESTANPVMLVLRLIRIFRLFRLSRHTEGMVVLSRTMNKSYRALGMLCYFMLIAVIIYSSIMYLLERGRYFYCTVAAAHETPALCGMREVGNFTHTEGEGLENCAQWAAESMGVDLGAVRCCSGEAWYISPAADDNGDGCADTSAFTSILITAWWAMVTMTTVGYGDMTPRTGVGKLLGSVVMLSGLVILALPITVIGSSFQDQEKEYRDERAEHEKKMRKKELLRRSGFCPVCEEVDGGPWPHSEAQCPQLGVAASAEYWRSAPEEEIHKREDFLTNPAWAAKRIKKRTRMLSHQRSQDGFPASRGNSADSTSRFPVAMPAVVQRRRARIEIVRAEHLPKMDIVGSCDGFVRARLGKHVWTTGVVHNTYSPVWHFPFELESGPGDALTFEVFDKDFYVGPAPASLTDEYVGAATLELWSALEKQSTGVAGTVQVEVLGKDGQAVKGHDGHTCVLELALTPLDQSNLPKCSTGVKDQTPVSVQPSPMASDRERQLFNGFRERAAFHVSWRDVSSNGSFPLRPGIPLSPVEAVSPFVEDQPVTLSGRTWPKGPGQRAAVSRKIGRDADICGVQLIAENQRRALRLRIPTPPERPLGKDSATRDSLRGGQGRAELAALKASVVSLDDRLDRVLASLAALGATVPPVESTAEVTTSR
eukprot:CAMPEP_0113717496 /NCGR_PEP_ID=MMETSP0038_2-20120614/34570_1 /TAXON_ID=2898 /ORGANISM="Cryptomonas paramecium" /LENGTH=893 /DNA_ID=CAMNT_0000645321 /DNA_START=45 /DNA_END=2726 /DNA_ORIENTATION=+ /assembly_acc=CAM_ASM_000170